MQLAELPDARRDDASKLHIRQISAPHRKKIRHILFIHGQGIQEHIGNSKNKEKLIESRIGRGKLILGQAKLN